MSLPERPYLSIGEVLGLLLDEFPDVSISKIRFLESQGLIGPERTPSGYRKFYDADVERLRVILREQRENFLPLRVIRDRLESGEIDDTGGQSAPRAARSADDESGDERTSGEPGRSPSVSKGDAADRPASGGPSASGSSSAGPGSPTPGGRPPSAGHDDLFADDTDYADDSDDTDGVDVELRDVRTSNHPAAMHRPAPAPQPPSAPPRAADFFAPGGDVPPTMLPVERSEYSAGDVCALARLTARQLGELESFGLVSPTGTGTTALYSPNDLAIATIAAKFMERGIEARHLRAGKQAAEREAALFEQLIAPMLRQRNPQSRQMAADTLAELSGLGEQLRDALLRIALGDHLEP
ncbi:MAG: MerR family transcriptional regulator [Ilumatobacteraceae bacterium]